MRDWLFVLALAAWAAGLFLYSSSWSLRNWKRMWGVPHTAYEILVFQRGARTFGLLTWAAMWLVTPLYSAVVEHHSWLSTLLRAGVSALVGFPLSLWGGYLWGRVMAWFFGIKDPAEAA